MKYIVKKLVALGKVLMVVIPLFLLLSALLRFTAERFDLRGYTQAALEAAVGPVTFRDWEFRLSPFPELICYDIHSTAAANYGVDQLQLASLRLRPQLWKLLNGQLVLDEILLEKPVVQIDQAKLRAALAQKTESSPHFRAFT